MRGWMLAGIRRAPGPLIGTVVSAATAAALSVAALSIAVVHEFSRMSRGELDFQRELTNSQQFRQNVADDETTSA